MKKLSSSKNLKVKFKGVRMVQNSKIILLFLLLSLTLLLQACVPLLVVAAGAAGKSVISDKPTESPKTEDLSVSKPDSHAQFAQSKDAKQKTSAGQNSSSHKASKGHEPLTEQVAKEVLLKTPIPKNNANHHKERSLLKNGWKIKSQETEKNNIPEAILYFDSDNHYYGFDGCKYFKGNFVLDFANEISIKTLLVSSTGSDECGNKIEINLFLANSFKLRDDELLFTDNDKVVLTLTHIDNFNSNDFLRNARLNTQKKSPNFKTKTKTKTKRALH
jgi:hypothetical protein